MKKAFILGMLACVLLGLAAGCTTDTGIDPTINLPVGKVQGINIIPGILWIEAGKTYRFEARGIFPGNAVGDVTFLATWFSDDPSIAQMLGPGLVLGKRAGLAHVTCNYSGVKSSTATVAIPGVPLTEGIVPVHFEVSPGSLIVPIEEPGVLSFVPTPATAEEMSIPNPKPGFIFALGDAGKAYPPGYWMDTTITITSGAANGLKIDVLNNFTSPIDTDPLDLTHPFGPDWLPDNTSILIIGEDSGFPANWGVLAGDTYRLSKRWLQFNAVAEYSDGSKADVTYQSEWHLSDPTLGYITNTGFFNSTSAVPSNQVVYAEFSGLVSNYVPISVH